MQIHQRTNNTVAKSRYLIIFFDSISSSDSLINCNCGKILDSYIHLLHVPGELAQAAVNGVLSLDQDGRSLNCCEKRNTNKTI